MSAIEQQPDVVISYSAALIETMKPIPCGTKHRSTVPAIEAGLKALIANHGWRAATRTEMAKLLFPLRRDIRTGQSAQELNA